MTQKGLAPVLIVVLIALTFSGYLIYQRQTKSTTSPEPTTPQSISQSSSSTPIQSVDEKKILEAANLYLSDRDKHDSSNYAAPSGVQIDGEWAVVYIVGRDRSSNAVVPAGVGIMIARRSNSNWKVARSGDPEFLDWLQNAPNSLIKEGDKKYLR